VGGVITLRRFVYFFSKKSNLRRTMRPILACWCLLWLAACGRPVQPAPVAMSHPLFTIPFDTHPNQTVTYHEAIACYEKMAAAYPDVFHLSTVGSTDSGYPLHVGVLSLDGQFEPQKIRATGRRILLINNGIHPGEPEGIDATLLLLRDYLTKPELRERLRHVAIVFIPVYNIDGCLRRGSYSRANQDGPEAYGFRGNDRNYDLNRDFVKCDSRNARSFNQVFRHWNPDIFVDNHTSNGADYQYTMTLIPTLHSKLEAPLGDFLTQTMLPELYADMKNRNWEMIPYVDTPGPTPDSGIINFCDYGRYSTGYAALWNTIGFMPETHMLKPFADRLWSTYHFMDAVVSFIDRHHAEIGQRRAQAFERTRTKAEFDLDYAMDPTRRDTLLFKGYTAKYKPSAVSGLPRLWYDRAEPYEKPIPYFNYFNPSLSVAKPSAYIIPQAWEAVINRLEINQVALTRLEKDTALEVESYRIVSFKNREAWEGHYFHSRVVVEKITHVRYFAKGDYVARLDQDANRYLIETLEPQAPDSWFAWNFFDAILAQKEYFSDYVFEDLAADFLDKNPSVRAQLEAAKAADPDLAADANAQLDWVYRHSPWYEPTHRLYPVARVCEQ
jgi:hypothetical protein